MFVAMVIHQVSPTLVTPPMPCAALRYIVFESTALATSAGTLKSVKDFLGGAVGVGEGVAVAVDVGDAVAVDVGNGFLNIVGDLQIPGIRVVQPGS